jgi:aspartate racemase
MTKIIIGALVGMGVGSTAPFYDSVMNYARKLYHAKNDIDFPEIVMISLPTPFVPGEELDHQQMITILVDAITRLNSLEVSYIVIPCNIVHLYYESMQRASSTPILNIVTITVEKLSKLLPKEKPIALIATSSTCNSGLYQKEILARGFELFHTQELQSLFDNMLIELKANQLSDKAKTYWQAIVDYLKVENCAGGVVACTDISSCVKLYTKDLLFVDSMDALAEDTIRQYMHLKNIGSSLDNGL